ncbi:MAG: hypothetical protein RL199_311 [Pseudomonadota bacterium]|jgi:hypothetical protein
MRRIRVENRTFPNGATALRSRGPTAPPDAGRGERFSADDREFIEKWPGSLQKTRLLLVRTSGRHFTWHDGDWRDFHSHDRGREAKARFRRMEGSPSKAPVCCGASSSRATPRVPLPLLILRSARCVALPGREEPGWRLRTRAEVSVSLQLASNAAGNGLFRFKRGDFSSSGRPDDTSPGMTVTGAISTRTTEGGKRRRASAAWRGVRARPPCAAERPHPASPCGCRCPSHPSVGPLRGPNLARGAGVAPPDAGRGERFSANRLECSRNQPLSFQKGRLWLVRTSGRHFTRHDGDLRDFHSHDRGREAKARFPPHGGAEPGPRVLRGVLTLRITGPRR